MSSAVNFTSKNTAVRAGELYMEAIDVQILSLVPLTGSVPTFKKKEAHGQLYYVIRLFEQRIYKKPIRVA